MKVSLLGILRIETRPWLVLITLFPCAFLPLHGASLNDLTYTTTDGKVTITDCNKAADGELVIPETILGNPVTSIGELAFWDCFYLKNITIPNGVVSIGNQAFTQCGLVSITIPDSVTSIGNRAFRRCSLLKSITIPDSVTSIGEEVFHTCSSLTSITIPDSVTSIGREAFSYCESVTNITIGDGVTSIGDGAFQYCSRLTLITFQGVAPTVAPNAFKYNGSTAKNKAVVSVSAEALSSFGSPGDNWNSLSIQVGDGTPNPGSLGHGTPNSGGGFLGLVFALLFFGGLVFLGTKIHGSGRGGGSGGEGGCGGGGGGCGGGCGG